jgi:hypothetical protein
MRANRGVKNMRNSHLLKCLDQEGNIVDAFGCNREKFFLWGGFYSNLY